MTSNVQWELQIIRGRGSIMVSCKLANTLHVVSEMCSYELFSPQADGFPEIIL